MNTRKSKSSCALCLCLCIPARLKKKSRVPGEDPVFRYSLNHPDDLFSVFLCPRKENGRPNTVAISVNSSHVPKRTWNLYLTKAICALCAFVTAADKSPTGQFDLPTSKMSHKSHQQKACGAD